MVKLSNITNKVHFLMYIHKCTSFDILRICFSINCDLFIKY